MRRLIYLVIALSLSVAAFAASPFNNAGSSLPFGQSESIPTVDEAMPLQSQVDKDGVHLTFSLINDVYLYRPQLSFTAKNANGAELDWDTPVTPPPGEAHNDEVYGSTEVYFNGLMLDIPLSQIPAGTTTLVVGYQGCLEDRLCYPPQTKSIALGAWSSSTSAANNLSGANAGNQNAALATTTPAPNASVDSVKDNSSLLSVLSGADANQFASWAGDQALGYVLLLFFIGGLLMAFTPCVFPMFPILLGILAGSHQPGPLRGFMISLAYVLGMAIPFTLAGLLVALSGAQLNIHLWLQQPAVILFTVVVFVLLAISMFGLFDLQAPQWLRHKVGQGGNARGSLSKAALIGALSGLVVSPCITPVLAGSLLYVAAEGNAITGAAALFALSIGMGIPLLIIGAGGANLLPKAGAFMEDIKRFFGLVLLLMAIWLLGRLIDDSLTLWLYGIALFLYALMQGALDPSRRLRQALTLLLLFYASLVIAGAAAGGHSLSKPLAPFSGQTGNQMAAIAATPSSGFTTVNANELAAKLEAASDKGKPVLVDFFADWCVACKELDNTTLSNPQVLDAMSEFRLIRVDITETNDANLQLMRVHKILGLPALLFFDRDGNEIDQARILGYMSANQWLNHMKSRVNPKI